MLGRKELRLDPCLHRSRPCIGGRTQRAVHKPRCLLQVQVLLRDFLQGRAPSATARTVERALHALQQAPGRRQPGISICVLTSPHKYDSQKLARRVYDLDLLGRFPRRLCQRRLVLAADK